MYKFLFTPHFKKKYLRLTRSNFILKKKIAKAFLLLENFPFHPGLKTHKVISRRGKSAWSSTISGELRIIWNFNKGESEVINLLDIGGHSGGNKVYL